MGAVHDGLAADPGRAELLQLSKEVERQFVVHKTPDTAAVVEEMSEAEKRAQTRKACVSDKNNNSVANRNQKWATDKLKEAKSAFALVAPFCPQYEKSGFFNRQCKHCQRRKDTCEASRPAKERVDVAQAKYDQVNLSAEHFMYLLVISFW